MSWIGLGGYIVALILRLGGSGTSKTYTRTRCSFLIRPGMSLTLVKLVAGRHSFRRLCLVVKLLQSEDHSCRPRSMTPCGPMEGSRRYDGLDKCNRSENGTSPLEIIEAWFKTIRSVSSGYACPFIMCCVHWSGRSGPLCRIGELDPAERTLGCLLCFSKPFIEAALVKNMITW